MTKTEPNIVYFNKDDNKLEKLIEAWFLKDVYGWSILVELLTGECED